VDSHSFYESISVFPAAHWGTFSPGDAAPRLNRFWDFPDEDFGSSTDYQQAFDELLDDSVRLRLRSDVPLGITLSGGLDSTAILHASRTATAASTDVRAYTAAYADASRGGASIDERAWARVAVAPYQGVDLREITASSDYLLALLRRIVWYMDGPGFSPAVFPVWRIAEAARDDGVKVLLDGQGADELLGGYPSHMAAAFADSLTRAGRDADLSAAADVMRIARGVPRAFSPKRVLADLLTDAVAPVRRWDRRRTTAIDALRPEFLRAVGSPWPPLDGPPRLRRRLLEDFARDLLPGFLHYGDAISMAHSIEARVPFLDHRLVELCFRMPGTHKVSGGQSKAVLRSYLRSAGQDRIARRRRKRGYPTPAGDWLAADHGAMLRDVLLDPGALTSAYVDPEPLARLIDRHADGMRATGDVLFGLLCTELWLQVCVRPSP
jgi:asparagine synthase (glutamine-hydrolysing)